MRKKTIKFWTTTTKFKFSTSIGKEKMEVVMVNRSEA
jgi:hypothetical protein